MRGIVRALKSALESCLDLRIFFLLFVPFFLAMIIACVLFFTLGTLWVTSLSELFEQTAVFQYLAGNWQISQTLNAVAAVVNLLLVLLVILPLAYGLSVIIVSIFLMPFILRILEEKGFSSLQKKRGGSLLGNLGNTLGASAIYGILLVITLPLWLFPGLAIAVPVLLGAFLNKRVFVYDVLEDYASKEEMQALEITHRKSLYLLGIILGGLGYFPLTFIVMPVFAGLAYSYFCLNALKELRENRPT